MNLNLKTLSLLNVLMSNDDKSKIVLERLDAGVVMQMIVGFQVGQLGRRSRKFELSIPA